MRCRCFDIAPKNPYEGDSRVEYICGDVCKQADIESAMRGVETCYSTFAIIRFCDRLPHQAELSYKINVGGTERVIEASRKCNVQNLIVTSTRYLSSEFVCFSWSRYLCMSRLDLAAMPWLLPTGAG